MLLSHPKHRITPACTQRQARGAINTDVRKKDTLKFGLNWVGGLGAHRSQALDLRAQALDHALRPLPHLVKLFAPGTLQLSAERRRELLQIVADLVGINELLHVFFAEAPLAPSLGAREGGRAKNGGLGVKRRNLKKGEQTGRPPGRPPEG